MAEDFDSKARLVREICDISTLFTRCSHISGSARKPGFIDWYLILKVDVDSGSDTIRKRYRQLALQLHPDKNLHPKAEVAFKLILEAYECLSDESRRRAFDSDRKESFCNECHRRRGSTERKQHRLNRASLRQVQSRLREECRVVERCLRGNEAAAAAGAESPLFDPSDPLRFPGYPHCRKFSCASEHRRSARWESSVYQLSSDSRRSSSSNAGFRF